jgi:hypothetical protein
LLTPLNTLAPSSQDTSLTPSTEGSKTPVPPLASSSLVCKPNKRYIKVEEILRLTSLKKNKYNNLCVSRKKTFEMPTFY